MWPGYLVKPAEPVQVERPIRDEVQSKRELATLVVSVVPMRE